MLRVRDAEGQQDGLEAKKGRIRLVTQKGEIWD